MDKKAFRSISYGLYIVCSKKEDDFNGQIANTAIQITSDPPTIAVSINKENLTHDFIEESKVFTVSILDQDVSMQTIGKFGFKSGREINKFEGIGYELGKTGAPLIKENIVSELEAEVISSLSVDTHTIFVGKIVDARVVDKGEPMTYAYYHQVKKGKAPKTAPTYQPDEDTTLQEEKTEDKIRDKEYRCLVCGYIYDPQEGDIDNDISPGTTFEELPDDWVCPICGAGKEDFEPA